MRVTISCRYCIAFEVMLLFLVYANNSLYSLLQKCLQVSEYSSEQATSATRKTLLFCRWLFHFTTVVADAWHVCQSFDLSQILWTAILGLCRWVIWECYDFLPFAGSTHDPIFLRTDLFRSLRFSFITLNLSSDVFRCLTFTKRWNFHQQSKYFSFFPPRWRILSLADVLDISPLIGRLLLMTSLMLMRQRTLLDQFSKQSKTSVGLPVSASI